MDYSDLRHKTPLDFTSDKEVLRELCLDIPEVLESLPNMGDKERIGLLYECAVLINNEELIAILEKEFPEELCEDLSIKYEGVIID